MRLIDALHLRPPAASVALMLRNCYSRRARDRARVVAHRLSPFPRRSLLGASGHQLARKTG
jgi:hypothetical protein